VLASPVICSDETSVRVKGKNWWEWVFIGTLAVLHTIKPSRGKAVVTALFGTIQPEVWLSDMLGSQRGHGVLWQCAWPTCCATRNTRLNAAIRRSACRSGGCCAPSRSVRQRDVLKDATLKQYLYDLDRRLDRIMAAVPIGEAGRKLHKRMLANRSHLFVFMSNRAVPEAQGDQLGGV
jgi:transposase